jgi:tetratricopeptide (TPR) repeat protein
MGGRVNVTVLLISFLVILLCGSHLMAASDTDRIEQLIKINGKSEIISIIRKNRQNHITLLIDGEMEDSVGPPDEKYVTAKTIREDLINMRLKVSDLEKMCGQNAPIKAIDNLHKKASTLFSEGKYDEALIPAKEALAKAENQYGVKSIELSNPLSLLANIQSYRNQYQDAAQYLERLRSIQESTLGTSDRKVADTISRLIKVYGKLGNIEKVNNLNRLVNARWGFDWGGGRSKDDDKGRSLPTQQSVAEKTDYGTRSGMHVARGAPVCKTFDSANKLRQYTSDNDPQAFAAMFKKVIESGECYLNESDEEVFIVNTIGLVQKFRYKGMLDEHWTWWSAIR